ncbi:hypothetical protein GIB67_002200 [Kingdonia uniflora]|uniref:Ubiquitin-like protease family profile domain-containing protein n=1 Tax=Kingdonia uniflora TaxID=39325 RepID=A0A7J7KWP8_9MAGN|nr:hypothetical protein GIB67_002200 [Kingdonia uniflora]
MADDKILSYNDVVLRRSDLSILSGPYFLNDRIIEFYFSYLETSYASQDILLVPPSISFWIANCPDVESLKDFVVPLKFPDKKVIIFAVNNNNDVNMAEGGTHWSLLAYERNSYVFVHHDSMAGSNRSAAKNLCSAVVGFMGLSDDSGKGAEFMECSTMPQQTNGYDCGLYVTSIAKAICIWHKNAGSEEKSDLWFSALNEDVKPSVVSMTRKHILWLIENLMAKK